MLKTLLAVVLKLKLCQTKNQLKKYKNQLLQNLKKRKVCLSFKDNIWAAYLVDIQLISKFNKGLRFLLCVTDVYSKYAWVVPSKNKKDITITSALRKILDESNRKPNKIWEYKGSELYKRSMK